MWQIVLPGTRYIPSYSREEALQVRTWHPMSPFNRRVDRAGLYTRESQFTVNLRPAELVLRPQGPTKLFHRLRTQSQHIFINTAFEDARFFALYREHLSIGLVELS